MQGPCDCDLIRLGHASRGRAVRETRPGLLLRATLRRNEAAEALLREVFKADSLRFSIVFLLFSSDFDLFVLFFFDVFLMFLHAPPPRGEPQRLPGGPRSRGRALLSAKSSPGPTALKDSREMSST